LLFSQSFITYSVYTGYKRLNIEKDGKAAFKCKLMNIETRFRSELFYTDYEIRQLTGSVIIADKDVIELTLQNCKMKQRKLDERNCR